MFVPKIDTCLTNLLTNHEDVEIGRCVILATGHACTWAFEMQTLFYHRAGGKDDKVRIYFYYRLGLFYRVTYIWRGLVIKIISKITIKG